MLVEDHFPRLIGNPIAMMTQDYPELIEAGERLLKEVGYTGFVNMDVKIDPRDGRAYFLEINPRIGRNCYYMVVAGANPMVPMAADLIDGERPARVEGKRTAIYSLIPNWIIGRYLCQPRLGAQVKSLLRKGAVQDPMINSAERDLRRAIIVRLQKLIARFTQRLTTPDSRSYIGWLVLPDRLRAVRGYPWEDRIGARG